MKVFVKEMKAGVDINPKTFFQDSVQMVDTTGGKKLQITIPPGYIDDGIVWFENCTEEFVNLGLGSNLGQFVRGGQPSLSLQALKNDAREMIRQGIKRAGEDKKVDMPHKAQVATFEALSELLSGFQTAQGYDPVGFVPKYADNDSDLK